MLCTSCSSPVRPIVALDIDGTMGFYHTHFLSFAATYFGWGHFDNDYNGHQPFREWFCDRFECDVRTFRDIKLAYRQGAQKRSMPVTNWARPVARAARQADAEIWVTTTRPYMRLDNVDPDTRFWLDRYDVKYDHLIYGDHKYADLATQIDPERVCFVLEDLWEQLSEARRLFNPTSCYLYATQWNHYYWRETVVGPTVTYDAVLPTMMGRIEAWTKAH